MFKRILTIAMLLGLGGGLRAFSDGQAAALVLGQPDFSSNGVNPGGVSASTIHRARRFWTDGVKLAVADTENNRVLLWDSFPTSNFQAADRVLGQANFTSNAANRGGSVAADTLYWPHGIHFDGSRLWVADMQNNRVLWFNGWPSSNGQAADGVLGQAGMTGNLSGTSQSTLYWPTGVHTDGSKLVVADTYNHRVLIYNSVPAASATLPDVVVGPSGFTTNAPSLFSFSHHAEIAGGKLIVTSTNNGIFYVFDPVPTANGAAPSLAIGPSSPAVSWATGFHVDAAGDLWIANAGYNRVQRFHPLPTASGAVSDVVIGQASLAGGSPNRGNGAVCDALGLSNPYAVQRVGAKLIVSDVDNERILVYQDSPTSTPTPTATPTAAALSCGLTNGQAADLVLGQTGFYANAANQGGSANAATLQYPFSFHWDGTYFWVNDANNSRVLRFTGIPSSLDQPADLVLGQANFSGTAKNRGGTPGAGTLSHNHGVWSTGSKLIVVDSDNSRVLIWNSLPTVNGQAADVVLGQSSFSGIAINETGSLTACTSQSLYMPEHAAVIGGRLYVTDSFNNRVLVWNSIPTVSHAPADAVIFQPDFTSCQPNRGATPAANSIYRPVSLATDGTRLAVADYVNNRVLIFNSIPTSDGPADVVVGKPNMATVTGGSAQPNELYLPRDVFFNGGQLVVNDYGWNRILLYPSVPTSNGASASTIIGQPGWGGGPFDAGLGSVNPTGFREPSAAAVYGGRLWVADWYNHRILAFSCGSVATPTPTPSLPPQTQSATPSATTVLTPGATATRTATPSPAATGTPIFTATPTSTVAATFTATASPSPVPSATLTMIPLATFTVPTSTFTASPTPPPPTPVPTQVKKDDDRVDCHPNHVEGHGKKMKVKFRSYSGGQCSLRVRRSTGRALCDVWKGYMAPQELRSEDWDTHDSKGDECPSGVYYVVFQDGDGTVQVQKVLVIR